MRHFIIAILFGTGLLSSCSNDCPHKQDVSGIEVKTTVQRIDREMESVESSDDIRELYQKYPALQKFIYHNIVDIDSVAINFLHYAATSSKSDSLRAIVQKEFRDFSGTTSKLEEGFKYVKYYYPDFEPPEIYTIFSSFGGLDIHVSDQFMLIGLEYFLPEKSPKAKVAAQYPEYMLKYMTPEHIPSKTFYFLSNKYNASDMLNQTLLSTMITHGKALYFAKRMLPCTQDSIILEYTSEEMAFINHYKDKIWSHFVTNELFYNEDREVEVKYINPRPKVLEVADQCPGRIGRWLGYEIVSKYMEEHPDITLPELMEEKDAKKIFTRSHYKPKPSS